MSATVITSLCKDCCMFAIDTICISCTDGVNGAVHVQREIRGDTFDLGAADAAEVPMDALIPGRKRLYLTCLLHLLVL